MYNNLPNFFFDNPLIQQQVTALLIAYQNQQKTLEQVLEDIQNLQDIKPFIKNEIVKDIQQMADDGTLQTMVAEVIAGTPTKANIDMCRVGRKCFKSVDTNIFGQNQNATYDSEYYSYTQGATSFLRDGLRYWAICNVSSNYSHFNNNNVAEVIVYNNSGNIVMKRSATLGHANDITYNADDDSFYIIWNKTKNASGVEVGSKNVTRIAWTNFTTAPLETKTPPTDFALIGIDYFKGDLFICDDNKNVFLYNWNDNTIELIVTFNNTQFKNVDVVQNIAVTTNFIYWLAYRPNCLIRYNRQSKTYDYVYYIPKICNYGMYVLGEPQGFDVDDNGNLYMITSMHTCKKAYNQFDMTQFWKQNIFTNGLPPANVVSYDYKNLVISVDGKPGNNTHFNPDGTDGNEFDYIAEAILYAATQTHFDKINIELLYSYSNNYVYITSNKTFNIIGKNAEATCRIGGVQIDGGYVTFQDIHFFNSLANDSPKIDKDANKYEVFARDCTLNFAGCNFLTGKNIGIFARRCFINNDGATYGSGVTNDLNTTIINNSGAVSAY